MYKRTSLNDDEFISPKEKNRENLLCFERERDGKKRITASVRPSVNSKLPHISIVLGMGQSLQGSFPLTNE